MPPTLEHESELWGAGHRYIAGLDEVGRGCLAGPVMAGAVVLPQDEGAGAALRAAGLRDSKKLSARQRETLVPLIEEVALAVAVGEASAAEIDEIGIVRACALAMRRALARLACPVEALLLDAFPLPNEPLPQRAIVRGDDALAFHRRRLRRRQGSPRRPHGGRSTPNSPATASPPTRATPRPPTAPPCAPSAPPPSTA